MKRKGKDKLPKEFRGPARGAPRTREQERRASEWSNLRMSLDELFRIENPEWKNPHDASDPDHFRWEMRNFRPMHEAFKAWVEERNISTLTMCVGTRSPKIQ